ncbi:non-ribosomal peptide synthetase [Embleya hyalina]|uniref:Non-ribosomal peptide synthetase n=1 Tax=Embleya hyalina TaxID=516124 RepID=A0A401Z089_9ACTN|nr:non-ribosomal peptide synthetase [Embleya hyalina]GCE00242.1 non-ribosomal peptide synthetase [Embleya hyalina]
MRTTRPVSLPPESPCRAPVSPAQHGIRFTELAVPTGTAHHMPLSIRFTGDLDRAALAHACDTVVVRHPVLGSALREIDGEPWLVPADTVPRLVIEDLTEAPDNRRADLAAESLRRETLRPFDPETGPLVRFTLVDAGPGHRTLLVVAHHLAFDGGSKDILVRDLAAHYAAFGTGVEPDLPDLAESEDAERIAREAAEAERRVGLAEIRFATEEREPPAVILPGRRHTTTDGDTGGSVPIAVDDELRVALAATAELLGVSTFALLLGALHVQLWRYGNERTTVAIDLGTRTPHSRDRVGPYVNELPIHTTPSADPTFRAFVQALRADLRDLYPVRDVPLGRVVTGLTPRLALAPVSMSYRRRTSVPDFAGLPVSIDWTVFNHAARGDLHVQCLDDPNRLALHLHYASDAFGEGAATAIAGHYRTLLRAIVADPDARLSRLALQSADARERMVRDWNDTARETEPDTLPAQFTAQAARTPESIAVECGATRLTYARLDAAVDAVARRLRSAGIGRGDLVAVCARRTAALPAALLGVLRAGAAYLPLDPEYPSARLAMVLEDCAADALLTERDLLGRFPGHAEEALLIDGIEGLDGTDDLAGTAEIDPAGPDPVAAPPPTPGELAYALATSGSTGRPKGVEIEHRALGNLLASMRDVLACAADSVWLGLTSASFDISAVELYLPLITGGRLVLAEDAETRDGRALLRLIRGRRVTHVQATPSGWRMLLDAGFEEPAVCAVTGGEPLPVPLARELRRRARRLVNAYGPTETTVWSSTAEIDPDDEVTIGRPIANTRMYVLDRHLTPTPVGVAGDLYIGGDGLARGYRRLPAVTADRFGPDPYGPPGARLYRTGDLARYRDDGRIDFLGRDDHQVKILGHRVELGEIEGALLDHAGIAAAAVTVRGDGSDGAALVAYLVPRGAATPSAAELRVHLTATLPRALVPGVYVPLERLPLTPNGKLDRAALPAPPRLRAAEPDPDHEVDTPADTGPAAEITAIWREVLGLDDIRPDEDLFDLGGHSLTVTRIGARIRKRLGVDVPLHVFFETPTISGLTSAVSAMRSERRP